MVQRPRKKRHSSAESRRDSNELSALFEVAKDFLEIEELKALKQQIVFSALGVLGAKTGVLLEFDSAKHTLATAVSLGQTGKPIPSSKFPLRRKWQEFLFKRKQRMPLDFSRGGRNPKLKQFSRSNIALVRTLEPKLLTAICEDDRLYGVLCLQEKLLGGKYTIEDYNVLTSLTNLAAKAWGKLASVEPKGKDRPIRSLGPALSKLTPERIRKELHSLRTDYPALKEIVGQSRAILSLFRDLLEVAKTKCPVLILGKTGTGKELAAKAIHQLSSRGDDAFVELNCASVPSELIESELFGYERGAFTGATRERKGVFEQANHGTLFLDEIGDMSRNLQTKLLRVIQEGRFRRLGGEKSIEVDVRIIAASNKDLTREARKGNFREDLLYRINVYPISLAPLEERREDIPLLADHFLKQTATDFGLPRKSFSKDALELLKGSGFPGNIRELKNIVERVALRSGDEPVIDGFHLVHELGGHLSSAEAYLDEEELEEYREDSDDEQVPLIFQAELAPEETSPQGPQSRLTLSEIERSHIERILDSVQQNRTKAAKILGIPRSTLIGKMKKLGMM